MWKKLCIIFATSSLFQFRIFNFHYLLFTYYLEPKQLKIFGLGTKTLLLFQVSNYSTTTVEVKCQSGYSGGLSQRFIMEVFETVNNTQVLVATNWTDLNVGNNQEVNLGVGGLLPDSDYIISVKASNERGESSPIYVGGSTR